MRGDHLVRTHLLQAIAAGTYPPGARLPTERDLCDALSVGRGAVRDALAVLEGQGRITRRAGSGTYVAPAAPPPQASPAQVMEARLALEPQLAHLVAANATAADLRALAQILAAGAAAPDLPGFEVCDRDLHAAIARAAGNPLVIGAYDHITAARDQDDWGELKRQSLTPARRALYQQDHTAIVTALCRRDAAGAEAALRAHLLRVRANLIGP